MPVDLPPVPAIEISVASRGYSKGVAQTNGPQVIIRPEVSFGDLRIAGYGKNVTSDQFEGEAGISLTYRRLFGATELAGTTTVKHLLDANAGVDKVAIEFSASLSQSLGALKPRASLTYSPDDVGTTGRTFFWEAGASYQLGRNFSVQAGGGIRARNGGPYYRSLTAGLLGNIGGGFSAEARIYATSRDELGDNYRRRVVFLLRKRI